VRAAARGCRRRGPWRRTRSCGVPRPRPTRPGAAATARRGRTCTVHAHVHTCTHAHMHTHTCTSRAERCTSRAHPHASACVCLRLHACCTHLCAPASAWMCIRRGARARGECVGGEGQSDCVEAVRAQEAGHLGDGRVLEPGQLAAVVRHPVPRHALEPQRVPVDAPARPCTHMSMAWAHSMGMQSRGVYHVCGTGVYLCVYPEQPRGTRGAESCVASLVRGAAGRGALAG